MTVAEFETLVLSQRPAADAWQPVTDYSFDARRVIEGRHPQLIRDVLQPTNVLDVGCGPERVLSRLLRELGIPTLAVDRCDAYGEQVLDITRQILSDLSADVVICREVLEHLTVLQIRRAVTNLCALSSRLVYLTTRFHPQPSSLLDVATSDDLDPTHCSMLNQDFLRTLFVLEGFRRRADFEEALDWKHVGRVLVYERV